MKATLYHLPARNVLVIDDGKTQRVEYPATETRAHQMAQDAGVAHLTMGRVEELVSKKSQPVKMQ